MREVVEWILRNFHSMTVYVQDIFEKSTQFAVGDLCKDSNCSKNRVKYWSKEFVEKHDSFFAEFAMSYILYKDEVSGED